MPSLNVIYYSADMDAASWIPGLQAALPGANVNLWEPGAPAADYAVVWKPPQQLLDEQPGLKAIFNTGAGVDALMKLDLPQGVPVIRLDDAGMSVQMAEYVCHTLIRHFREFDGYETDMDHGKWSFRKPRSRLDYPVGVLGLGVLGERVARAVAQFDFPVNGWSRSPKAVPGIQSFAGEDQLDAFLAASRVVVCLLPLTPDTENLLNAERLAKICPGGYVINVARGAHVVDADLIAAIDSGHLAGATLDVFRVEPLPKDHAFWAHPKITLTPHTSARTLRSESIAQIAFKIGALQRGEAVAGRVDAARGY
ncbi:glyoxylate/hydroxypyruvate reductase A [Rhodoferax saidenbachensis]|uniref:Glyoxylate/hydroxypyruvate reductase A n=1 Tax=Rhodoferax saidenbachensis TaxID=1484693 RepID=A0ABU1ZRD0_9BURK|nr:glyoxylate/hydroxypyruvate reductase A [Rhodoferax saidenbachensis]MDR7308085.1 glyoxylate/hydroxypyruvate reductase A [Rhodoferax saidenbachensis]